MRVSLATPRAGSVAATMASTLPTGLLVRQVMNIGSRFVKLDSPDVLVSTDSGQTWTSYLEALAGVFTLHGAAGNGYFVTVYGASAYRSTDGITWDEFDMPEAGSANWSNVGFGAGLFVVAVYGTNRAYTSPDGETWTLRTLPSSTNWRDIAWSGNLFLLLPAPGGGTAAASSPDGITWTARTLPASVGSSALPRLYGGGNSFFFLTTSTTCYYSTDAISWNTRTIPGSGQTQYAAWNGSVWLISQDNSDKVYTTSDGGANWTTRTVPLSGDELYLYQYGSATYVFVAGYGPIYTTTDSGANFNQLTYSGTANIVAVLDLGASLVAMADAGAGEALMLRSTDDAASWSTIQRLPSAGSVNGSASWSYLAWDGATTLIAAPNGWSPKVARSTDSGQTWSTDSSALSGLGGSDYVNGLVWTGASFFIGMQTTNKSFRSTTGLTWTQNTSIPSAGNRSQFVGGNNSVVFGGNGGVAASTDAGITWTSVNTSRRLLGFDGASFVARNGSGDPNTSASTTGVTWTAHSGYENTDIFEIAPYSGGVMARSERYVDPDYQLGISVSELLDPPNFSTILDAEVEQLFSYNGGPAFIGAGTLHPLTLLPSAWSEIAIPGGSTAGYISQPFWTGRAMIAPDDEGIFARTVDGGLTWTTNTIADAVSFTCGAYGGDVAVMLGYPSGGDLTAYLSYDHGLTWVVGGVVSTGYVESIVWDAAHSLFVAVEYLDSVVYTSPDGLVWTPRTTPVEITTLRLGVNGVLFAYRQYATTNEYCTSTDGGITWTARTTPVAVKWGGLAANTECTVVVGYEAGLVLRSIDNINWTQHTAPVRSWIGTAWNGRYFCAIAEDPTDDCTISSDGRTWVLGDFLPTSAFWFAIATDGEKFYAFPYSSTVVYGGVSGSSLNRVFWTELTGCTET